MKKFLFAALLALPFVVMTSCSDDDDNTTPIEISRSYQLVSVSDPAISGTAKFINNADGSVTLELQLTGTTSGDTHPAHIHFNSAAESGGIALTLTSVEGDTGFSSTTFTELDDMTAVTYNDMLDYDGYINVHLSSGNLGTLIAQGDIGANELTGTTVSYNLNDSNNTGISGSATFAERMSGETLVVLSLNGTDTATTYEAAINDGNFLNPGALAVDLTDVDGETGKSISHVSVKVDDTPITYTDLIAYDGHIAISADGSVNDAQGNIGSNAN